MCGILAILRSTLPAEEIRKRALELSKRLRHRGPDWNGIEVQTNPDGSLNVLCHERLGIVDPFSGKQPLLDETGCVALTANGEIYNHKALEAQLKKPHTFKTKSDCEVIVHLYEEVGEDVASMLDGMFSFVLSDSRTGHFLAARDPLGVTPLYIGWGRDGSIWFSSELKAIKDDCERFEIFPPGHLYNSANNGMRRYYLPSWWDGDRIPTEPLDLILLRKSFEAAVVKRMMCDVPYGVLLSGGLDSSLCAAIAARHAARRVEDDETTQAWFPRLHSFAIGLHDSPDLKAAREVAEFLGTAHHEFNFTVEEGIDAIPDVIYHLETFDVTTIRASTPMYFLSRKIKSMGVKMVLTGEGSDEVFGGYLYFHKAPNKEEFHKETVRKLKGLHQYDLLRANKSLSTFGLEGRVPFLDKAFLEVAMNVDPQEKMVNAAQGRIEKYIMRKAFDVPENPYLPHKILYRQKEQFSDGVGYSWIDGLKAHAERTVTDTMFANAQFRFPEDTPKTKEAYFYRSIFESHFPQVSARQTVPGGPSVACSTPAAIAWDASFRLNADPSGRSVLGVHDTAKQFDDAKKAAEIANGVGEENGNGTHESPVKKRKLSAH
eukprot:GILJ01006891.1.p1 GENE.GILJ01006891.1~~GILJ01006891.1.p1  ORF type:complete len:602 (-),score=96.60 GILJ01006891.1:204-2009(-)